MTSWVVIGKYPIAIMHHYYVAQLMLLIIIIFEKMAGLFWGLMYSGAYGEIALIWSIIFHLWKQDTNQ